MARDDDDDDHERARGDAARDGDHAEVTSRRRLLAWLPLLSGTAAAGLYARDAGAFCAQRSTRLADRVFGTHDVMDYGARPGSSSEEARTANVRAITRAARAAHQDRGGTVLLPPGQYWLNDEIDLSRLDHVVLAGASPQGTTLILDRPHRAIVSMLGASYMGLRDLTLYAPNPAGQPQSALLLGRTSAGSAGYHHFVNVECGGYVAKAAVYSIASENNTYERVYLHVDPGSGGQGARAAHCFYTAQSDRLGLGARGGGPAPVASSNISGWFQHCSFVNISGTPEGAGLYIEGLGATGNWIVRDSFFGNQGHGYGVVITANQDEGSLGVAFGPFVLDGIYAETLGPAGILLKPVGRTARSTGVQSLTVKNTRFSQSETTHFLYAADGCELVSSQLTNNSSIGTISLDRAASLFVFEPVVRFNVRRSLYGSHVVTGSGLPAGLPVHAAANNLVLDARGISIGAPDYGPLRGIVTHTFQVTVPHAIPPGRAATVTVQFNGEYTASDALVATFGSAIGPAQVIAQVASFSELRLTIVNHGASPLRVNNVAVNVAAVRGP